MVGERLGADSRDFEPRRVGWAQEQFLAGNLAPVDGLVRSVVAESWALSAAQVPLDLSAAPVVDDAAERWHSGPIARAFAPLADDLATLADDGDFVAAVTDETGAIVWMAGGRTMRRRAEEIGFAPGGRWDEEAVGTNALGLALRTGRPASIRATEHFAPMVHDWVCYSAPIISPFTGAHLGVLDLSTTWSRANPLALSTVTALARNVELILSTDRSIHLAAQVGLRIDALGGGAAHLDGVRLALPPRQVELLTILSLHPGGLGLEAIHDRLHGDHHASPSTTKAELSHLRRSVSAHLASRPYRLEGTWSSDHGDVVQALRTGRLDDAVALYRGPLLPRSESPTIEDQRNVLETAVRSAVIADPTPARLAALCTAIPGDPYLVELAASL
jgi:hypothetical protein